MPRPHRLNMPQAQEPGVRNTLQAQSSGEGHAVLEALVELPNAVEMAQVERYCVRAGLVAYVGMCGYI
jgi:hypothetical protein